MPRFVNALAYPTMRTRWGTLAIMPRIEGVSSRSTIWFSRVKPRPLMTSLCFSGVAIFERKYCSLILALVSAMTKLLLQFFFSFATQRGDIGLAAKLCESVEGGLDNVVRILGTNGLGQHVLNAGRGHHRTHRSSSDHSGTLRSRLEHHLSRAVVSQHLVRNRGLRQVDLHEVLLRGFDSLANGLRNLLGLTRPVAHDALGWVADDDQCRERHVLATLDDLGDAVDGDHLVLQVEPVRVDLLLCCHSLLSSFLAAHPGRRKGNFRTPVLLRGRHRPVP